MMGILDVLIWIFIILQEVGLAGIMLYITIDSYLTCRRLKKKRDDE